MNGVRFYKSVGQHRHPRRFALDRPPARGWPSVTFTGETATGWQTASFAQPVQLVVGQTYVISYFTPTGRYAATPQFFATPWDNTVLTAPAGTNGVFNYGASDSFPNNSYNSSNYWVDPIFQPGMAPDTTPPTVSATIPIDGAPAASRRRSHRRSTFSRVHQCGQPAAVA